MELNLTNEEKEAIKYYRNEACFNINQLLNIDSRLDVILLTENEDCSINYEKNNVINYIDIIKKMYSAVLKSYFMNEKKQNWAFYKNSTITNFEKVRNEPYIDNFILANVNNEFDNIGNQILLEILGNKDVPYIYLKDIIDENNTEVIISPFNRVKQIYDDDENNFKIEIERQELQEMSDDDKIALYNYIVSNADSINNTIFDTVKLEKENISNYENIRMFERKKSELEMLMAQKDQDESYSDLDRTNDNTQLQDFDNQLEALKEHSTEIFNNIKNNNKIVTEWKKNVAIYLMAECADIEEEILNEMENDEKEIEKEEEKIVVENVEVSDNDLFNKVKAECNDNEVLVEKLITDIKRLINRQQNFAKIAGNVGASYSALNNSFDMKSKAEKLLSLIGDIKNKVDTIGDNKDSENEKRLLEISEVNNQISILINYLNNPKAAIAKSKMNRFDEMIVVEENELKRDIARALLEIRGEAELKKLRDDTQIIEEKTMLQRLLGFFTGQNRLDDFMIEQINLRKNSIRKTMSKKLRLDYNYSVHEFVAEIRMFIRDNEDDELVIDDVKELKEFEKEIEKNFIIIDSKVEDIIAQKEGKNLPIDGKLSKKELIEIETYRFLNKYGYDSDKKQEPEEIQYVDTTSNEIARIIDYINTSKILG